MQVDRLFRRIKNRWRTEFSARWVRRPVDLRLRRPVVSFTFDDFPASAQHTGAAILEQHGIAATFYVSLGLAGTVGPAGKLFDETDLTKLLDRGHELGCHTYDHCHAWNTEPREYERSIVRNRERLGKLLPGVSFGSHAYPISSPRPGTKRITARHFECARGGRQRANVNSADLNLLNAFFIEKTGGDFARIQRQIDAMQEQPAWLIFATHDVGSVPSPFGCSVDFFSKVVQLVTRSRVSVLPISKACESVLFESQSAANVPAPVRNSPDILP